MRSRVAAFAIIGALALAGAAQADKERVHLTRTGQRLAHAAILHRKDLGPSKGWTGKARKPQLLSTAGCPGFEPKQSDLLLVGAAEVVWKHAGIQYDSEAQVLHTHKMVLADWRRTVLDPRVVPCLKRNVQKSLTSNERVSYVTRLPFPGVANLARLFRTVIVVHTKTAKTPVLVDAVVIGKGRTEITLTTTALYAARKAVTRQERRLARRLVARAR